MLLTLVLGCSQGPAEKPREDDAQPPAEPTASGSDTKLPEEAAEPASPEQPAAMPEAEEPKQPEGEKAATAEPASEPQDDAGLAEQKKVVGAVGRALLRAFASPSEPQPPASDAPKFNP